MQERYDTPTPIRLDVRVPGGFVEVEAAETGETTVQLEATEELLERSTVELQGNELRIHVRDRKGFLGFGREEVRVHVRCPEGSALAARSKSAAVGTTGWLASVSFETAAGDLSVDRTENVSVQSASGAVTVGEATGDLSVQTASGAVKAGRVGGKLSVQVISGEVTVHEAAAVARVSSVSGDVTLETVAGEQVKVESVSGDVEVGVRRGSRVHVDASSISGDTRSDLDLGDTPVGEGEGPLVELRIQTVSGDIAVVRAAATRQEV